MHILFALTALLTAAAAPVTVHNSAYGRVVFDQRGFALYSFGADKNATSSCHGACLKRWPAYKVGGKQVVFHGHPLYYYVGDTKAGQILCQNVNEFGGFWRVVRPNGTPVR
jgi:predicted lipoprotein with Yx(FWY)xxD motif